MSRVEKKPEKPGKKNQVKNSFLVRSIHTQNKGALQNQNNPRNESVLITRSFGNLSKAKNKGLNAEVKELTQALEESNELVEELEAENAGLILQVDGLNKKQNQSGEDSAQREEYITILETSAKNHASHYAEVEKENSALGEESKGLKVMLQVLEAALAKARAELEVSRKENEGLRAKKPQAQEQPKQDNGGFFSYFTGFYNWVRSGISGLFQSKENKEKGTIIPSAEAVASSTILVNEGASNVNKSNSNPEGVNDSKVLDVLAKRENKVQHYR